jgi:hypothetical protein
MKNASEKKTKMRAMRIVELLYVVNNDKAKAY